MKSAWLLAGGTVLLSSCNVLLEGGSGESDVRIDALRFGSNFTLGNGVSYGNAYFPSGSPIICDNFPTTLNYTFFYSGDLASWTSTLVGLTTGQESDGQRFYLTSYPPLNGSVTVNTYFVGPRSVPLSLKPQSIVVNPDVVGVTKVRVRAFDSSGGASYETYSNPLPVLGNCY